MLWIEIVNDGTGDTDIGNYNYKVGVNNKIIEKGRITNHPRGSGWMALVRRMLNSPEIEED